MASPNGETFMKSRFSEENRTAVRRYGDEKAKEAQDILRKRRTPEQESDLSSGLPPALEKWFAKLERQLSEGGSFNSKLFERYAQHFSHREKTNKQGKPKKIEDQRSFFTETLTDAEYQRLSEEDGLLGRASRTREEIVGDLQNEQRAAYESWFSYLLSQEGSQLYKPWFRYFALHELLKKDTYGKTRNPDRTAPVATLHHGALSQVYDELSELVRKKDLKAIEAYDFHERYNARRAVIAETSRQVSLETDKDGWATYTDPNKLANDSAGTPWCLAGLQVAKRYLSVPNSKLRVLAPHKEIIAGVYVVGSEVREVRGADDSQNLDPTYASQVQKELTNYDNGSRWREEAEDARVLGTVAAKTKENPHATLSPDELRFLYELKKTPEGQFVARPIQGFGYQRDPRIAEVRKARNPKEDAPIALGCKPGEIAWEKEQINERTKAYVGPLFKGIFNLPIEHLYTSFPEGRVVPLAPLEIGDKERNPKKRKEKLLNRFKDEMGKKEGTRDFETYSYAFEIMERPEFTVGEPETLSLVHLSVADLGFQQGATTQQIFDRAQELGLALVPPETGPRLRLAYDSQPNGEYLYMGMHQIAGSGGHPRVFSVFRYGVGERWLDGLFARPDDGWDPDNRFVFRKSELKT